MRNSKLLFVCFWALSAIIIAVSGASAKEYTVEWFNNMNCFDQTYHNSNGYCTNLKIELTGMQGVQKKVYATEEYKGQLGVQNSYTMKISTPKLAGACESMKLSATCTYNKFGTTVTETDSRTVSSCSSGKAIILINDFGVTFYPAK